jgi:hypothetical protein
MIATFEETTFMCGLTSNSSGRRVATTWAVVPGTIQTASAATLPVSAGVTQRARPMEGSTDETTTAPQRC